MGTIRLTTAQALVRYLAAQEDGGGNRLFHGVWAIFGHGNVSALGEALHAWRDTLPTFRAHNEQAMGHAAVAFAKASRRRRMMACTSSIGPGASNMITAAAVAHVNRLPVLFLPGDVFASRRPDPVLQQVEAWADGTVSVNDAFRPVSRYFDRIARPEQLLAALPRAMQVLTDPAECGPVTLALCQDTQAEAMDWPETFFSPRAWRARRPRPDAAELRAAAEALREARSPLIVAGGGVISSKPKPRWPASPRCMAFRSWRPRPAKAPSPITTRASLARSVSPAPKRRTARRDRPTSCWRSAPGYRISPPARVLCFAAG